MILLIMVSCENYLEPEPDNRISADQMIRIPQYAEGLLLGAYDNLPVEYGFDEDIASDDAVTNELSSDILKMATEKWNAEDNPISKWEAAFEQIHSINSFLQFFEKVTWDTENNKVDSLHKSRLKGEAFGLRAWYEFLLLQYHAGETDDGIMSGFPLQDFPLKTEDDWKQPRNTYLECINKVISDCDTAIAYLPDNYEDAGDSEYNQALGGRWTNRMTADAVRALKSRVLLYAASPAYNPGGDLNLWVEAAMSSGSFISSNGGLSVLSPTGLKFWNFLNNTDPEVIWSRAVKMGLEREMNQFPPSLFGKGKLNPTQDLVEAFPMINGYPIKHSSSGYDSDNPYINRDKRLEEYILFNGNNLGPKGVIYTHKSAVPDGINVQTNSTRTGYYLKKLLVVNVNIEDPVIEQNHFYTYCRWTEIILNYAEAANEAWGPDNDGGGFGITARDAISALRARAGIDSPDNYLNELVSREAMRDLIHTERRLELCFEGHRFWDIRRWKDIETMQSPVSGVYIDTLSGDYKIQLIEDRSYVDYMIYGPVPLLEVLKYDAMKQNMGW